MPRVLEQARVGWPPALRELKDLLYRVYLAAGTPTLDTIVADIDGDSALRGAPRRDTVRRCISDPAVPAEQADVVSVGVVLARRAAWDGDELALRIRELWGMALQTTPAGRPIGEFDDRLVLADLEVHPAFDAGAGSRRLGALPAYVRRDFDARLDAVVSAANSGQSSSAVLVGGSSTGKTRALWEAVRRLPADWRLWHPISPSRPEAALADLPAIAPRTVVWLNEAQHYLGVDGNRRKVAAGMRALFCDPARGPVLILATLWPEHWDLLTRHVGHVDGDRRHLLLEGREIDVPDASTDGDQARLLLEGRKIDVPDAFTQADLSRAASSVGTDPRLTEAVRHAQQHQITQYLAGVPLLTDRYRAARGTARALIEAAMDARRLGAGTHIPLAWLVDAVPGYLTDTEWNTTEEDWFGPAFAYAAQECNGIPGILMPVKAGNPRNRRGRRSAPGEDTAGRLARDPCCQLADYLDQYGRSHRADRVPPIDFWTAAATYARPTDLAALGDSAAKRGLHRDAAQLFMNAAAHGDTKATHTFLRLLHDLQPADHRPAQWAVDHFPLGDLSDTLELLATLREIEANEQAVDLATRSACLLLDHLDQGYGWHRVMELFTALRDLGEGKVITAAAARAITDVSLDDPDAVADLLLAIDSPETRRQAVDLATRAAARVSLDDPNAVANLVRRMHSARVRKPAATLAARAADHVPLDDLDAIGQLLAALGEAGASEQVASLADRVARVRFDDPAAIGGLLIIMLRARADEQATLLAVRAADRISLDDPAEVTRLLTAFGAAGAQEEAVSLATRAAAHVTLTDPAASAHLLASLYEAGMDEQAAVIAARAVTDVSLEDPVVWLLTVLHLAGAQEQAAVLAARAATDVRLDDLDAAAWLLMRMWAVAKEQAAILASRIAAHVPVDDPGAVSWLLAVLLLTGAEQQAESLAGRAVSGVSLDDPSAVSRLLDLLWGVGARDQGDARPTDDSVVLRDPAATTWLVARMRAVGKEQQADIRRSCVPGSPTPVDDPSALTQLWAGLRMPGAWEQATSLADRVAVHVRLDNPAAVGALLAAFQAAGAQAQTAVLAARAAADVSLSDPDVTALLESMWAAGEDEQAGVLASRAVAGLRLDDPGTVGRLLNVLRASGADDLVAALLDRNPADHVTLEDTGSVVWMLARLRAVGADEQAAKLVGRLVHDVSIDDPSAVARLLAMLRIAGADDYASVLLARDPATHVRLEDPGAVDRLVCTLQGMGAKEQAAVLSERIPGLGLFDRFASIEDRRGTYRYGREPDGNAATQWTWDDLEEIDSPK